tara:strand:+ start:21 stop:563 length:543 start_codon:yes stop_codon:yes gene_type:complete
MSKKITFILLFFFSIASGSEISISISENLVNDYLKLIGNHEIPKGPKENQATWSIKSPEVKFEYGSAEFFTTVTYKKGKTNIKKSVKKNIFVEYNFDNNQVTLVIDDPIVKMERKGETLGKLDLSTFYQSGLKFHGPKPKERSIKLKTSKGKVRVDMNIKKSIIYFEKNVVRVALDLEYK